MLSLQAEKLIEQYFNLPFQDVNGVRCPYFNNARANARGQLKVLIGKGTPEEIVAEAQIISIQYHHGFFEKDGHCCLHGEHRHLPSANDLRHFLIDNNLGVECSGFATNVLRAHYKETKNVDSARQMFIVSPKKRFWRYLISRLRPVENIGVRVYADDQNSAAILKANQPYDHKLIQPGDVMTMLAAGPHNKRNHIILFTANDGQTLRYVHARAWSSEGKYGHGVARGEIRITKPGGKILEQTWVEMDRINEQNETYLEAKTARVLEVRRLNF